MHRTCTRCHDVFPLKDFAAEVSRGREYRRSWCKYCLANYYRIYTVLRRDLNRRKRLMEDVCR